MVPGAGIVWVVVRMNDLGQPVGVELAGWAPPPFPAATALEGRYCRLEPADPGRHGADLYGALQDDRSGRQWTYLPYGPFDGPDSFVGYLKEAAADPGSVLFCVVDQGTGRAEGMARYSRIDPVVGSIEVGGVMFGPRLRRSAGATEAMYLMAAYVFDELGYRRYEWKCDALNAASIAAAERLGFCYEGTWRNATIYKGRNRDTAWFSLTSDDWRLVGPTLRGWLEPSNFVDGHQRTALSRLIHQRLQGRGRRTHQPG